MGKVILSVRNLHVSFTLRGRELHALRGVDLDVADGESLSIVGESGSGKSVLNKNFIGLLDQNGRITSGEIRYYGMGDKLRHYPGAGVDENGDYIDLAAFKKNEDWLRIRGSEICMIPQDPMTSLNPLKSVGWQISEALMLHRGMKGKMAYEETIRILEDVRIDNPRRRYKQYHHELSGGMRQRVVIAIAIACNPRILICDEPTTALDVTVQAQVLHLLRELKEKYRLTIIFITHDLGVVANVADRVAVMYAGDIVEIGLVDEIFYDPRHLGTAEFPTPAGASRRGAVCHSGNPAQPVPGGNRRRLCRPESPGPGHRFHAGAALLRHHPDPPGQNLATG